MIVTTIIIGCIVSYTYQTREILLSNNDKLSTSSRTSETSLEQLERNKELVEVLHSYHYDSLIRKEAQAYGSAGHLLVESIDNMKSALEAETGQNKQLEKLLGLLLKYESVALDLSQDIWINFETGETSKKIVDIEYDDRMFELETINYDYEEQLEIAILNQHKLFGEQLKSIEKENSHIMKVNVFLAITAMMVIGIFSYFFIYQIQKSINTVINAADEITDGKLDNEFKAQFNDEMVLLLHNINNMRQKLKAQFEAETSAQNLLNRIFEVNNSARGGIQTEELCQTVLTRLCNAINADCGIFYCMKDKQLYRTASLDHNTDEISNRIFALGEGLVGQCGITGKIKLITDIENTYSNRKDQMQTATPRNLLFIPVQFNDSLIAVIELGSYGAFSPDFEDIINATSENIGIALQTSLDSIATELESSS